MRCQCSDSDSETAEEINSMELSLGCGDQTLAGCCLLGETSSALPESWLSSFHPPSPFALAGGKTGSLVFSAAPLLLPGEERLHLVVADYLVELIASDDKCTALGVAEASAADLGVSHTLRVQMLKLQETSRPGFDAWLGREGAWQQLPPPKQVVWTGKRKWGTARILKGFVPTLCLLLLGACSLPVAQLLNKAMQGLCLLPRSV